MNDINNIRFYAEDLVSKKYELINTSVPADLIEKKLNKLFDKYPEICKYYINLSNSTYNVSFNVGLEQLNAMNETMFQIKIFKNIDNGAVLLVSNQVAEHPQWNEIYIELLKLKKND
jgi:hypothetical protein